MEIRDFKYAPEDVDCRYCTRFIRGRCRANGCSWLNERIEAGVIWYSEALDETFLELTPLRRRVKLVSACSHSFWKDAYHHQRFAAAQAIFGIYCSAIDSMIQKHILFALDFFLIIVIIIIRNNC